MMSGDVSQFDHPFRPFSDDEKRNGAPEVVKCREYQREVSVSQNIAGKQMDRVFIFDTVL